jgi:EAL domain-containing protein (putative c-di-GMP-specific phosphodiesterase class I)
MWEVEDNKAVPANLVREQDFILRIRRLHRLGLQQIVVNLRLTAIDATTGGRGAMEEVQQRLQNFAETTGGAYAEMSGGDCFLIWPDSTVARTYPDQLLNVVMPEGSTDDDTTKVRQTFILPNDYGPLRERANDYVEASRTAAIDDKSSGAAQALQGEFVRGPLTPWAVTQIEKLLNDISIKRHIRRQALYARSPSGVWQPQLEECFVALAELHRTYFPKLDLDTPNHLFLELCQALDRRLLAGLTRNLELIRGQKLTLNIAVLSVLEAVFSQFSRLVPPIEHPLIGFEVHAGDFFQDVTLTRNAFDILRREGFRIIVDGITPEMLPYVNFALFDVDAYKINVSVAHINAMTTPEAMKALASLPHDKLIFFHCDSKPALALGEKLGVSFFQGWLIDDLAGESRTKV